MSAYRKIAVCDREYLWKYIFDDDDYQNDSFIVIKSADKKGKLVVYFRTGKWDAGYCPFHKGVPALYKNSPVTINLNQPRYIAEIIFYALNQFQCGFLSGSTELDNGIEILHDLGYEFEYEKKWDSSDLETLGD